MTKEQIIQRLNDQMTGMGLFGNMGDRDQFFRMTLRFGDNFAATFYLPRQVAYKNGYEKLEETVEERIAEWILNLTQE